MRGESLGTVLTVLVSVGDVDRGSDQLWVDPVEVEGRGGVVRVVLGGGRYSAEIEMLEKVTFF